MFCGETEAQREGLGEGTVPREGAMFLWGRRDISQSPGGMLHPVQLEKQIEELHVAAINDQRS